MTPTTALLAAIRAEFAAVYLYGLLGGRASRGGTPAERTRLREGYASHRLRRDQLLAFLGDHGVPAPAPAVAYAPPIDPVSLSTRTACARLVEERCITIYAQLVAAVSGAERAFAMNALSATSVAAAGLGEQRRAFPGLTL